MEKAIATARFEADKKHREFVAKSKNEIYEKCQKTIDKIIKHIRKNV